MDSIINNLMNHPTLMLTLAAVLVFCARAKFTELN